MVCHGAGAPTTGDAAGRRGRRACRTECLLDGDWSDQVVLPEDDEIAIRVVQFEQRDDTRLAPDRGEFRHRVAQPLVRGVDIGNSEAEPDRRTGLMPVSPRDDAYSDLWSAVQDPTP